MGVINIRPLAAGAVTGRGERHPNAGNPGGAALGGMAYADDVRRAGALEAVARQLGLESAVELAVRFALVKPGISTVLIGFSDEAQLEDAIRWSGRGPLPGEAVDRVLALRPHRHESAFQLHGGSMCTHVGAQGRQTREALRLPRAQSIAPGAS